MALIYSMDVLFDRLAQRKRAGVTEHGTIQLRCMYPRLSKKMPGYIFLTINRSCTCYASRSEGCGFCSCSEAKCQELLRKEESIKCSITEATQELEDLIKDTQEAERTAAALVAQVQIAGMPPDVPLRANCISLYCMSSLHYTDSPLMSAYLRAEDGAGSCIESKDSRESRNCDRDPAPSDQTRRCQGGHQAAEAVLHSRMRTM